MGVYMIFVEIPYKVPASPFLFLLDVMGQERCWDFWV